MRLMLPSMAHRHPESDLTRVTAPKSVHGWPPKLESALMGRLEELVPAVTRPLVQFSPFLLPLETVPFFHWALRPG